MLAEKLARVSVRSPAPGTLVFWKVAPGQEVQQGDVLALYIGANGNARIPAPSAGVVRSLLVEPGVSFAPDAPLCYLVPAVPAEASPVPAVEAHAASAIAPTATLSPLPAVEELAPLSPSRPGSRRRRSTFAPSVERLTMQEDIKVQRYGTWLTNKQVEEVRTLSLKLKLDGHDYAQAEMMRAATEWLLALSRAELLAVLERNREREQQGGYGSGVPRPG